MKRKGLTWTQYAWVLAILFGGPFVVGFILTFLWRDDPPPHRSTCASYLKQISLGIKQYIQDYDNKYPLVSSQSDGWGDIVQPYLKGTQLFQCPGGASSTYPVFSSDYFYNARLASYLVKKSSTTAQTIMLGDGEEDAGTNANITELPFDWTNDKYSPSWRHLEGANYAFADGHVKWLKPEKVYAGMFAIKP